jgi:formylglycine-generating enzyme required for sulfatase activity
MPKAVRAAPPRELVTVAGGTYSVGLDPAEAEFFDQTPRHPVELAAFAIDRRPVGAPAMTGLSFDQAQAFCEKLGMRLPTESEWEVAAQIEGFVLEPEIFEWTASWYDAYPGNPRREGGYGGSFRVLRGLTDPSLDSVHSRRFMKPTQSNSKVGFRCARDGE